MDKLEEIVNWKRREIESKIRPVTERELSSLAVLKRRGPSFAEALTSSPRLCVIAEIKRRSPSAGEIAPEIDACEQARRYYNAEADAISVLTDKRYFAGDLRDLWEVNDFLQTRDDAPPTLRKDFMIHPVQIVESAEAFARAILIIVRALTDDEMEILFESARLAGLDSIFEIHSESELERALAVGATIVGVNNRNLARFETDLEISEKLIPQIPDEVITISESGISTTEDAARMRYAGADAVLVGEALMKNEEPADFIRALHDL